MAYTTVDLYIDIANEQSFRYLQAKQYDHNSREVRLIITDRNYPIEFTGKEYITLSMSLDGDNYSNTVCNFKEDGYPYILFTESMLSRKGDVDCEIKIFTREGGTVLTTFNFMLTISGSLLDHDRLIKSSEFEILNNLILQALEIQDLIEEFKKYKEIIDAYIIQINEDIQSYREKFTELSNEAQALIDDLKEFLEQVTTAEAERVEAEEDRKASEEDRKTSEEARKASETKRIESESERLVAEEERQINEEHRKSEEQIRISNENERIEAERLRKQAEESRKNAESQRVINESNRESAENKRIQAETERVQSESARQLEFDNKIQESTTATQEAIKAKEDIEEVLADVLDEGFLLVANAKKVIEVILKADEWTDEIPYMQIVAVDGIRETDTPLIECIADVKSLEEKRTVQRQWNLVDKIESGSGQITAYCNFEKPTIDLSIRIKGV